MESSAEIAGVNDDQADHFVFRLNHFRFRGERVCFCSRYCEQAGTLIGVRSRSHDGT
jgi:hypothetical protein